MRHCKQSVYGAGIADISKMSQFSITVWGASTQARNTNYSNAKAGNFGDVGTPVAEMRNGRDASRIKKRR